MIIDELILKVSGVCNLNCKYCYVFNQGDYSYMYEGDFITEDIARSVIEKIKQHCCVNNLKKFIIVFHGGEPLLIGKSFYQNFVNNVLYEISNVDIQFVVQTNGTLITGEWLSLFQQLKISIGMSLDGTERASAYRVFRTTGKSAYERIIKSVDLMRNVKYPVRILSVINTNETPVSTYLHLKNNQIDFVDFLFPDKTYDNRNRLTSKISEWLIDLFEIWYSDRSEMKPEIRFFNTIISIILGMESGYEVLGRSLNRIICIKPNGDIQAADNLMVCGDGFTKTSLNIRNNTIDEASEHPLIKKYYYSHMDSELCSICRDCIVKNICGGGSLAHRYSSVNGFDNPSAYCNELFEIIIHIQNKLIEDLPEIFENKECGVEKLLLSDKKKNIYTL